MQIAIFLPSINAICESNGNGRFSTELGLSLAKLSLEVKLKCRFSRKDKTISRKKPQPVCILAKS